MISSCTCANEYQDRLYGKNRRVFNPMGVNGKGGIRCTVCKREDKSVVFKAEKESKDKNQKG